ncbi:hypothetical protein NP493_1579g00059 [Ridgeia piscesae]|uniref:Uncharacterized protein n=1 Tax=Ridgeia piscesae TaxID=27915 RepID=A0AAD9JYX2_RIDPI|nr:hypothetical protein NP493_1579g00059 [Ridgeia piscesae]
MRARITRVRVRNIDNPSVKVVHRPSSFSGRLTDHDPSKDRGPLYSASQTCAEYHHVMSSGEVIELTCTSPP